jgi:ribosomal protein S18 acetylase RimI-like enzyme
MVCLEKLDRSDFEEVYRIMEQSFPADERRKKEGQQKLLDEEKYELLGVRNEGGLLAFLAVWEFAEFVFIEHFAVSEKARNSGIGGKMLEELARQKAGKVVLEVELPEDSLKKRRIGFYERLDIWIFVKSEPMPLIKSYSSFFQGILRQFHLQNNFSCFLPCQFL